MLTLSKPKKEISSSEFTLNNENSDILVENKTTCFETDKNKHFNLKVQLFEKQKQHQSLPNNFDKNKLPTLSDEERYDSFMSVEDDWTIEWSQIEKQDYVGAGTFGQVYKGKFL